MSGTADYSISSSAWLCRVPLPVASVLQQQRSLHMSVASSRCRRALTACRMSSALGQLRYHNQLLSTLLLRLCKGLFGCPLLVVGQVTLT